MEKKVTEQLSKMVGQKTARSCPDCGAVMVIRQNRQDGTFFLGCNRFPDCRITMEIDEAFILKLQGYKQFWEA